MKTEIARVLIVSATAVLCLGLQACTMAPLRTWEQRDERTEVRDMANQTLDHLYQAHRDAEDAVKHASGYAVFSDIGFKLLYGDGAKGKGVAKNNSTRQETFMKMFELQPGLGLGAAKFRVVFVFESANAFNTFVTSGLEAGANAMAVAKSKTAGGAYAGAVTMSSGVYMYQLTEEGAIVGVSITGAKFYKDSELQ